MAEELEFPNGLIVKAPHEKAPSFVKAVISIKVEDLGLWLREKHKAGEEWVNLDVKESRNGKWYASVSNFKKDKNAPKKAGSAPANKKPLAEDDIPF